MSDSFDSPDGRTYSGPVTAATPGQAAREELEATFRRTYALHTNDFRAKFEQARDAVMGAADAYAQAVAQADLLSRLRTVLLDLRTQPVEARIQALHLLDTAASPPARVQSAPDDALFWAWMDAYVDEPHNAQYEVPDMQRAFEGGMQAARDQPALAAQGARPSPGAADRLLDWAAKLITTATEEADVLSAPWRTEQRNWLSAYKATPPAQPAPELADAMAALTRVAKGHERVMFAAAIDIRRGQPGAARLLLGEQLGGWDGMPPWNGTETGAEYLERTSGGDPS